jgi:hypothetical protein
MTGMASDEVAILREEVRALNARVGALQNLLLELFEDEDEPRPPRYSKTPEATWHDVEDWVVNMMQDTLERRATNSRRWCPQWYKHPEVLTRFRILYASYREVEKLDAFTYSTWFLEHLDRHLDAIFSPDGPFAACSPERHSPHRGLTISRNKHAERDWGKRPPRPHEAKVNATSKSKSNSSKNNKNSKQPDRPPSTPPRPQSPVR